MRILSFALLLVPSIAIATTPTEATPVRSPAQVVAHLQAAGYLNVFDVDLDDGLWEAKVRKPGAPWREVAVDPGNGRIYDGAATRSVDALNVVSEVVAANDYTMLELAEPDGALWEVEATNTQGQCVSLRVDPMSRSIVQRLPGDC
jgi:hypothetical protein